MSRGTRVAVAMCVVWATLLACADARPASDAPPAVDPEAPPGSPAAPAPRPPEAAVPPSGRGPGCFRGGSTREEVLEIMGRPDSVVFGAYVYGRS